MAMGIAMLLAMWLRTAGLALPAALAAHYAFRNCGTLRNARRFDRAALHGGVVVAMALACTAVMSAGSIRIYLAHTGGVPVSYRERMATEFTNLVTVFCGFDPLARAIGPWAVAAMVALAFMMLWQQRGSPSPLHWFVLAYACMLINTPWTGGMRYLYPLAPALLVLAAGGIAACESQAASLPLARKYPAAAWLLSAGALGAISIAPIAMHGARYNFQTAVSLGRAATGPITAPDDAQSSEALALADWLRLNTPPEAILCAFKPRAVGYFAQRRTLHIAEPYAGTGAQYLADKGAHCFVMAYHPNIGYADIAAHLVNDPSLTAAFDNGVYRVFTPVPGNETGGRTPSDGNP
jgi:cytochrome c oxidase subunit 4